MTTRNATERHGGRRASAVYIAAAAVTAAAAALTTMAGPAHAGNETMTDPANDANSNNGEVRKLVIGHTKNRLNLRTKHASGNPPGDLMVAYLDVNTDNKGPELKLYWESFLSEEVYVSRVSGWDDSTPDNRRCFASDSEWDFDNNDVIWSIPRGCLKVSGQKPARVRVNMTTWDNYGEILSDRVPGRKKYGSWVKAG